MATGRATDATSLPAVTPKPGDMPLPCLEGTTLRAKSPPELPPWGPWRALGFPGGAVFPLASGNCSLLPEGESQPQSTVPEPTVGAAAVADLAAPVFIGVVGS